ncbi:MAG: ParB/RepB/Spo0J family partition protein [Pseudomonadota bacterium]
MGEKKSKRGLGRGLSALMSDVAEANPAQENTPKPSDRRVPIERIEPNPDQPRRAFDEASLQDLAASIREKGIIQPLIVRPNPRRSDGFEIVAGERRWRAAQIAQVHDIPVLIRDFDDTETLEIAIIENIQRADLNPVEEAAGYAQLMDKFGHTQEKLAVALGKSRSHIANSVRLLHLPEEVLAMLRDGRLSSGHARALITLDDPVSAAHEIVKNGLSVRQAELLAKKAAPGETGDRPARERPETKDADTRALENDLTASLGMSVRLRHKAGTAGGTLTISYDSFDALDDLCRLLTTTGPDA